MCRHAKKQNKTKTKKKKKKKKKKKMHKRSKVFRKNPETVKWILGSERWCVSLCLLPAYTSFQFSESMAPANRGPRNRWAA